MMYINTFPYPREHQSMRLYSTSRVSLATGLIFAIFSISHSINCEIGSLSNTELDASTGIQECINSAPSGDEVVLPPGKYTLESGLVISNPMVLRSGGNDSCVLGEYSSCANLVASPIFYSPQGMLQILSGVHDVVIDRLVIDGNRDSRLSSQTAVECAEDVNNRNSGRNCVMESCVNCVLTNSIIANALCASGFVWISQGGYIGGNLIVNNGDHNNHLMWADGITCLGCDGVEISGNSFVGNSDIDLIMGSGVGSRVRSNYFQHNSVDNRPVFGALMFDNFNGGTSGDFNNLMVQDNVITCTQDMCCFGIELGPHPWYPSAPIGGGFTVMSNSVDGAGVGINVDAAGNNASIVTLSDNNVSNTQRKFACGALCPNVRSGSDINVSPDSVVSFTDGACATSATSYATC